MQDCWEERLTKDRLFCSMRKGKGRYRGKIYIYSQSGDMGR